jgi:hypothetical protein
MADDRKVSPAYVSFQTFKTTVRAMAHDGEPPARVDSTVLPNMSGSTRAQFMGALRFLGLIDAQDKPSGYMRALCGGDDNEWKAALAEVLTEKYPEQLGALKSGTAGTFKESFGEIPASLVVPSARFLLSAARDSGLPVSKHITEIAGPKPNRSKPPTTVDKGGKPQSEVESKMTGGAGAPAILDKLLGKFPEFDPAWEESTQTAWFATFEKLMAMTGKGAQT